MIYATPCSPRSSIRGRLGGTSWPSSSAALHIPSTYTAAHYTGRSARRSCAGHDAGISTRPGYAMKRGARYPGGHGGRGTPAQPGRVSSRRSGLSGRRSWMISETPCSPRSSIRGRLGGTSWPSSSAVIHAPSTCPAAHYTGRSARRSCAGHDAGISTRPGYATKRGARYPGGFGRLGTHDQPGRVYSRRSGLSGRRSWMIYATPCSPPLIHSATPRGDIVALLKRRAPHPVDIHRGSLHRQVRAQIVRWARRWHLNAPGIRDEAWRTLSWWARWARDSRPAGRAFGWAPLVSTTPRSIAPPTPTPRSIAPPTPPALDRHEQLVQMPDVTHPATSASERARIVGPEGLAPLSDRFGGHGDPAFREEIFDIAKAQTKAVGEPDRVTDDLGRKAVAAIAWRRAHHGPRLRATGST